MQKQYDYYKRLIGILLSISLFLFVDFAFANLPLAINTTIVAGEKYTQIGSVVNAVDGDVNVLAKQIDVKAAENRNAVDNSYKFKQSGLTVSLSTPVTDAMMAVKGVADSASQVGSSKNSRVNAMATANTAYQGYQAVQSVQGLTKANGDKKEKLIKYKKAMSYISYLVAQEELRHNSHF